MSLISFIKEAGEKLFGRGQAQASMTESTRQTRATRPRWPTANAAAGEAILGYIKAQNLSPPG